MFAPLTRAPHLLLKEFYDLALSAPAALSLEATSRVASSWLFCFHVAWSTHGWPGGISREIVRLFERRCKGTLMKRGFANLFWEKCKKRCIFIDFQAKNSEFLERSVLFSSTLRIQYVCYDLLCVVEWIGVYLISQIVKVTKLQSYKIFWVEWSGISS